MPRSRIVDKIWRMRRFIYPMFILLLVGCRPRVAGEPPETTLSRVNHVVVIYLENRSFDNLYGEFAGADGLSNAAATSTQVDATGTAFATLPQVSGSPFPATLPNAPFPIEDYVAANLRIRDLVHRFYQEQQQIDGGRMDKFADVSDAKGEVMGFYHTGPLPLA